MSRQKTYSFVIALALAALSCGKKESLPENVLPREKFISVLIDMHLAEAGIVFNQTLDQADLTKGYSRYTELFAKHHTDSAQVANTFEHYMDKKEELLTIYNQVLDSLNARSVADAQKP